MTGTLHDGGMGLFLSSWEDFFEKKPSNSFIPGTTKRLCMACTMMGAVAALLGQEELLLRIVISGGESDRILAWQFWENTSRSFLFDMEHRSPRRITTRRIGTGVESKATRTSRQAWGKRPTHLVKLQAPGKATLITSMKVEAPKSRNGTAVGRVLLKHAGISKPVGVAVPFERDLLRPSSNAQDTIQNSSFLALSIQSKFGQGPREGHRESPRRGHAPCHVNEGERTSTEQLLSRELRAPVKISANSAVQLAEHMHAEVQQTNKG